MKNIWKYILGIGAAIGGVLFFFLSPTGNKKQFKKDLKNNKKKVKDIQKKSNKVQKRKTATQEKIKKSNAKIKTTKSKIKSTKSAKKTISDFEKKYRTKKLLKNQASNVSGFKNNPNKKK